MCSVTVGTGEVVTAIEILSPINKNSGEGRIKYEKKRGCTLWNDIAKN
ncbi:DUF4058 family protein [Okeania sp. SIO2B3]